MPGGEADAPWWRDAVVYQVYPRSFQDTDADGVGDLAGVRSRLDHLVDLGVDALWLSPFYPSPLADYGYDVSDYKAVDPVLGTLEDFDALASNAHERGLKVLLDLVPCHTSIEHPWFREHPDWYVWSDSPNNWVGAFGDSAWTQRDGRWYLHSFYAEQPDLDWRNPEVRTAMADVLRFWLDRGADGYRLDAIDRLLKDPELRDDPPSVDPFGLPVTPAEARLALSNSRNAPDTGEALAVIRDAVGDALLVGEVYLPARHWQPYLEHLDAAFAFELLHAPWRAQELRRAIAANAGLSPAWVLSNHDFGRLTSRFGDRNARAAAMLLLTLPGPAFLYQGDEIGQREGAGADPPLDRFGRDRHRHPMQWDASPRGGFSNVAPWLPATDPGAVNVADQREDPESMLSLVRALIGLRRELAGELELLPSAEGLLVFRRGGHVVAVNTTDEALRLPRGGEPVLESSKGVVHDGQLAGHGGAVLAR